MASRFILYQIYSRLFFFCASERYALCLKRCMPVCGKMLTIKSLMMIATLSPVENTSFQQASDQP